MMSAMNPRPVFVAALPREIAGLVAQRGWRAERKLLGRNIHLFEHEDAVVVVGGMGAARVTLAVEAALAVGPASELVSVGWAGACRPGARVGNLLYPDLVIDSRTGERHVVEDEFATRGVSIVTVAAAAGAAEKQRLGESYSCVAVEMEAAHVARLAAMRGVGFSAIKAVSDEMDFEMPGMERFSTADGQFREAAFAMHVAVRPKLWAPVMAMARGSMLAAGRLREAIEERMEVRKRSKL
jgi:adenosylhomocysteine nucleosidase